MLKTSPWNYQVMNRLILGRRFCQLFLYFFYFIFSGCKTSSFVFMPEEQGVNSAIEFWIQKILIMLTKLDKNGQNSFNLSQVSQGHNSLKLPCCSSVHIPQSHGALTSLYTHSYRQFSSCCFDITLGLIGIFYKHCFHCLLSWGIQTENSLSRLRAQCSWGYCQFCLGKLSGKLAPFLIRVVDRKYLPFMVLLCT